MSWTSGSIRTARCDGCDADYDEPIGGPEELRKLLVNEFALQFSFAPDQSVAVQALIEAGPFDRVLSVSIVDGYLGIDSLAKTRWGNFDGLLAALPNVAEVDLAGHFERVQIPHGLESLRLRGHVDAATLDNLGGSWPRLTTLELSLGGAGLGPLLRAVNAPALRRLWLDDAYLDADAWAALHDVVVGLSSLRLTRCALDGDVAAHVDALAPRLTHLEELWLPEDCFTAELARQVPHVDCSY